MVMNKRNWVKEIKELTKDIWEHERYTLKEAENAISKLILDYFDNFDEER